MPVRSLPAKASLVQLKHQARDLMKLRASGDMRALQRIREFHPRFSSSSDSSIVSALFKLSDAQLTIAREYGFDSWPRLRAFVSSGDSLERRYEDRITDPLFRSALRLVDAGDADGLASLLQAHPSLVSARVAFEGINYFRNPTLLNFVAENPVRNDRLPSNIVSAARVILDAGGALDIGSVNETLHLVCSGRVPRECGVQEGLISLLCSYGADPSRALKAAISHGEFEAVAALIAHGAKVDLPTAAGLGDLDAFVGLLPAASSLERHYALALASQFGHASIVRELLEAGEDPNRYNPPGLHSHSTPLHQAVWRGSLETVQVLVSHGARLDLRDVLFDGTPLDWAEYGKRNEVAEWLQGAVSTKLK